MLLSLLRVMNECDVLLGSVDVAEVLVLHPADDAHIGHHGVNCNVHQPRECFALVSMSVSEVV